MRKSRTRKSPESSVGTTDQRSQQAVDLATAEPDRLGNSVRNAFSQLSEEERPNVVYRLLTALKKAGVNIGQHLLLLGIPARTAEELTAPEIATLIRYVRINEPRAMAASVPVLNELLTAHAEPARGLKVSSRAA
ncbi:MAG: hypothetical protein WAU45_09515 [Blastocatellia bacterium]